LNDSRSPLKEPFLRTASSVRSVSQRRIAKDGALTAFGILMLAALVAWLQFLSCNLEDSEGEGSWVVRCWVFEEEKVPAGTTRIRVSRDSEPITVQSIRVDTHWHPLALAGWGLPPGIAIVASVFAVRRRNRRFLKHGAVAALLVLAFAFFISPLIAWGLGPY
jgi:small neutral amino acid transporter SnatA (MarC family)